MTEYDNNELIKQNNEKLNQINDEISKSYSEVRECLEERLYRMKRLLESGVLAEDEIEHYSDQVFINQRRVYDCESMRLEEMGNINRIITESEEAIKQEESSNEDNESLNE